MTARPGVVYLVGAGPGDPGLLTVRGAELLAGADVILHDRLASPATLAGAGPHAILIDVGKRPEPGDGEASHSTEAQRGIEALMIEHARAGRSVVRLKGGDPFVFGRGGEEAEALAAAGVDFEVVPGVTAGVAAPAYAGIPVTHREDASAVAFVTGHEDPGKGGAPIDWDALARFPGTLVIYMGVRNLARVTTSLIEAGRDPAEPAAVVQEGTLAGQRQVSAPLGELAKTVATAEIRAPAIVVVGPVSARSQTIAWLHRRPLNGLRVVVTRARAQASGLAATLAGLGADVVQLPAIRIVPRLDGEEVQAALEALRSYALVCLTSPNGADLLFEAMASRGLDARALANATIAAIGPGTAAALAGHGVIADIVPERFVAEAMVAALDGVPVEGRPVLLARAGEARDVLPDALRGRGARVDVVALYETIAEAPATETIGAAADADYVTFTSSSTVRNLLAAIGERFPAAARVVSIGPITSEAARAAGLEVHAEAERHDVEGLVEALIADARSRAP